jgi:hypothetical protein
MDEDVFRNLDIHRVARQHGASRIYRSYTGQSAEVFSCAYASPSILSFAVPKPQSADDPQQLETYRLLKKVCRPNAITDSSY